MIFPMALELLTEAAVTGRLAANSALTIAQGYTFGSLPAAEVQRQVLEVLEHDGYVERDKAGYRFVSKLLRDWWKARNQFGYIPTDQRGA